MKLALDINRYSGRIKPLHGVNNCPIRFGEEKIPEFESAGIPFVRTHDSGGPYGRGTLIDIPNIFRDFDADPDDPASYDFAFTTTAGRRDFTTVSNTGKSGTNQKTRRCGQARWKNISNSIPLPRNI